MDSSHSPWSRCIGGPSAPERGETADDDEEEDAARDQKGHRSRAVTMSSTVARKLAESSDLELLLRLRLLLLLLLLLLSSPPSTSCFGSMSV